MNSIRYTITESPHMWFIIAGITALATLVGTMAILIYDWSHVLARVFFYCGLALTIVFVVLAVLDWKERLEEAMLQEERLRARRSEE